MAHPARYQTHARGASQHGAAFEGHGHRGARGTLPPASAAYLGPSAHASCIWGRPNASCIEGVDCRGDCDMEKFERLTRLVAHVSASHHVLGLTELCGWDDANATLRLSEYESRVDLRRMRLSLFSKALNGVCLESSDVSW